MACCGESSELTSAERAEIQQSKQLDQSVVAAEETEKAIKKLLLLGAGESGKSTLFKQAISLYGEKPTHAELMQFVPIINSNIVQNIKTLVRWSDELRNLACPIAAENAGHRAKVDELKNDATKLPPDYMRAIAALWQDAGIQSVYRRRTEFQCNDSTEYFFTRLAEIGAPGYVPSAQDILRSRVRTTGIVETSFLVEGNTFKMYDVGGQRNERKKWIHCFENVTAVLFVAAISEYDQKLFEDESQNRMSEALSLFEEIVNSRWFRKTSIVLFLNKRDLFETKIAHSPITVCNELSDYDGDLADYESCSSFIKEKFELRLESQDKQIYTHITCATDTENMKVVFHAVQDIIIRKSLEDAGLLG